MKHGLTYADFFLFFHNLTIRKGSSQQRGPVSPNPPELSLWEKTWRKPTSVDLYSFHMRTADWVRVRFRRAENQTRDPRGESRNKACGLTTLPPKLRLYYYQVEEFTVSGLFF